MGIRGRRIRTSVNVSKYKEPKLLRNVDDIIKVAKEKGFYVDDKLNIESVINNISEENKRENEAGILIVRKDLPPSVSGKLFFQEDRWIMEINKIQNPKRQRFTLAHELGHFVLHKNKNTEFSDTTFFRKNEDPDSLEYNANEFAAQILMPEERVNYYIQQRDIKSIKLLADIFDVSSSAMRYRVEGLGYKVKNG
ncbi:MAG: ImmA/IrrE family metallo-endopeptidase [Prevotella sp.]|jgi:Zn-dependent peptidase ImmA (M78 family)|nr:ImmA/IrrE family metallo-endopeptidase [Prevotella sp.]MCH4183509.1 ImmA/IrrE family metallo-endopeptidase [Prevotella sp.]MCH4213188.1 ImmA/IrrE family metallo-endopeptidase [Prevotella sp.]